MLNANVDATATVPLAACPAKRPAAKGIHAAPASAGQASDVTLRLWRDRLRPQRRVVHAGEIVYRAGDAFDKLHVVHSGVLKIVNLTADGREQMVSLKLRGDWFGLDGIADGRHACDAVALDTGEVWSVSYAMLLSGAVGSPALLQALHEAMGREIAHERHSLMSVCTLSADARVADFLRQWAESLAERGLRTDAFTLRLTRAEIGNCLGLTLESVSRALSRLAREGVIAFASRGRRDLLIPEVAALGAFVQRCLAPAPALLQ